MRKSRLSRIIVIVGPTASGKSELGVKLAKKFNGEIVSADSRQIYRGMDVGTAKPRLITNGKLLTADGIPHHLIDIKNPDEEYTVAEYKRDAIKTIRKIISRGKTPIMVGGTGLYVKAVVHNLKIPKVKADLVLRRELEAEQKEKGVDFLMEQLVSIDPKAASILDPKNPRRVIRALEIALGEKRLFSGSRKLGKPLFKTLQIGIAISGDALRRAINRRCDEMLENGLILEVKNLVKKYPSASLGISGFPRAFDAIGYREAIEYLNGKISKEKLSEKLKTDTWHYAKRQMTWFKKDPSILWVKDKREAKKLAADFLL